VAPTAIEALPDGLAEALASPAAHPEDVAAGQGIEHRQTHISHLYLTRDRVYKLRKAVDLSFLSFASREARNADCLAEVALNRRLAPDVYLGPAPVLPGPEGGFVLGPPGETCLTPAGEARPAEHCVVMRRLPEGRDAQTLLERGALLPSQIDRLAALIARFHASVGLGRPAPWSPEAWIERVERPVAASFALARDADGDVLDPGELERLERAMHGLLERDRARFLARREEGRVVEGHGDLHLDAVWYEHDDADPVVIDCLEFDRDLRCVDAAAELAFFAMDAAYRGRAELGERLLDRYAAEADDYGLYGVVDYHILHRALVRASVAALAAQEPEIESEQRTAAAQSARRHLALMGGWLDRPRSPVLLVVTGLPGTGKSTAAAAAAEAIGGVVIASDRVRKHLAGVAPRTHPADVPGGGLYQAEMTESVYTALLERAEAPLASGRPVVLDATYARRDHRDAARAFARRHRVPARLLDVRCDEAKTLERLRARLQDESRISDAGPEVYRALRDRYQAPTEWGADESIVVRTDEVDWMGALTSRLQPQPRQSTQQHQEPKP